jgi:hypothetical protein
MTFSFIGGGDVREPPYSMGLNGATTGVSLERAKVAVPESGRVVRAVLIRRVDISHLTYHSGSDPASSLEHVLVPAYPTARLHAEPAVLRAVAI